MDELTVSTDAKRPIASSIEKLLGGWQFIWYDYEDHAPRGSSATSLPEAEQISGISALTSVTSTVRNLRRDLPAPNAQR